MPVTNMTYIVGSLSDPVLFLSDFPLVKWLGTLTV